MAGSRDENMLISESAGRSLRNNTLPCVGAERDLTNKTAGPN
jgi:hypothetical protein